MRWLARWARRMADIIDPPAGPNSARGALTDTAAELDGYASRVPAGQFRNGIEDAADYVQWIADGRPPRDPARRVRPLVREVIAPVAPGRQPYCVGCDAEHAPPLHYHAL